MIHIISGPPCAGKSTYVQENAKAGDLRVDYDLLALALGAANSHGAEGIIRQAAFDAREGAISVALKDPGAESWIIHTSPSAEHVRRYTEAGAEFVELDPGFEVCMERAAADGRPQQTIDGIEKWYAERKGIEMYRTKEFGVDYKDAGNGSIEGYASTWIRRPDSYGDVVKRGAFARTLAERWNGGENIPLLWAHQMDNLKSFIGTAKADEDEKGLHFIAEFDDTEEAQKVRQLYKDGRLRKFSFAYDVKEAGPVTLEDGTKANELRDLDLFEISCVCVPANDDAGVVEVKANEPEVKSGRRNSKKDADAIREAISLLQGVLGELDEAEEVETIDEPEANAAAEEPKGAEYGEKAELLKYIKNMEVECDEHED